MPQVSMQFEETRDVAAKYSAFAGQVGELIKSLVTSQEQLSANWEGKGFEEFSNRFNQLKPEVVKFQELLEDINKFLISAANYMEEADQKVARAAAGK